MMVSQGFSGCPRPSFSQMSSSDMIGLPDGVGTGRLVAMDQVEGVGIGPRPLVGQGHQGRVEPVDHGIDGAVARRGFPELLGEGNDLAMNGRRGQGRFLQGESFDDLTEVLGELSLASVAPPLASEPGKPLFTVALDPALQGAEDDSPLPSHPSKGIPSWRKGRTIWNRSSARARWASESPISEGGVMGCQIPGAES